MSRKGVFVVLFLLTLAMFASVAGILVLSLFVSAPPTVLTNSTLYLTLRAPFAEVEPADVFSQLIELPPSLRGTVGAIRKAKVDSRIKALVVRPEAPGALWAQLQEIREALVDFKTSGKPITAYLESGGAQEYYMASAATRIVLMPAGQLEMTGLASYELFFRGTLDKIRVYPDLLHIGDYKTASNTFTEKAFTPAHREVTRALNKDWYDELVRAVAEGRKLSPEAARAAIEGGPYLAEGAKRAGLVDELAYEDQIDDQDPIRGTRRLEADTYGRAVVSSGPRESGARIALLYAAGTIASGRSAFDGPGGLVVGSETFVQWLRRVRVDPAVRAVVVRVDSPGGSAIASEVIWRELMLTRDVKPLVVSMGDVAASGGYYIATPAHAIVAQPGTITGSIGVVTGKFVLGGMLDKLGIGSAAVKEGPLAEIYSPFKPFSTEERARIDEQMQATYDLFVNRVAEGRHQTADKIDAVAQGRVWTGHQARELGLVDELGGLERAIAIAKQRAKLDPAKDVDLIVYPAKRTLIDLLSDPLGRLTQAQANAHGDAGLPAAGASWLGRPELRIVESALATMRLFRRGEPLMVMPNVFFR